ncbi:MAG TPA: 5'-methylthioadenosine/S-adenosylhomocysteine nucleosidase [Candidatus Dormibacteraeota bacterium]|nr:5'-methylthioadenosine/S-adenosylhomocysteine nucleosidase [Candidatus Dormibacteraeota bacterium]
MPSVLIVTALAVETAAVRKYMLESEEPLPDRWGTYYTLGTFAGRHGDWRVAVLEVGQGNYEIAVKTGLGVAHVEPDLIILVGVAGGLKDVSLGDVVVAPAVLAYERGKETDAGFLPRPDVRNSDHTLVEAARHVDRHRPWRDRIIGRRDDPSVVVRAVAAGEKVLNSDRGPVREFLARQYSEAVAVEMEGIGLLAAAHVVRISAIVIRGISDLLANKEEADAKGWQPYAASHAAAFAFELLSELRPLPRADASHAAARARSPEPVLETRRWEWRTGVFAPSSMLRAEFAVVPFYGRERERRDLLQWAGSDPPLAVHLSIGPGGMGKTRLMIEVCDELGAAGWQTGFLVRDLEGERLAAALEAMAEPGGGRLVVIDYAETRIHDVARVVRRALRTPAARWRIVLLARSRGDWWAALQRYRDGVGSVISGPATTVERLRPLADDATRRTAVFNTAADAFAGQLPGARAVTSQPALDAGHYERVLYILVAALAAVRGDAIEGEEALLDFTLDREQRFLDDGVAALGHPHLAGPPILQAAAAATLAGSVASRADAARILAATPLLGGQPAAVLDAVAELLHRLYPGQAWLEGVLPDLLGEHLVRRALEHDRGLLRLFGGG